MIKSISHETGINIKQGKCGILFGKKMSNPSFQEKTYNEYREYFEDQSLDIDKSLYYIYRGVSFTKDSNIFKERNLRYDITMIFPGTIGKEPIHTVGHFHIKTKDGLAYSEIYQIVSGEAMFLFQDINCTTFYVLTLKRGQKVIIPPGIGHITVNASRKKNLIIANIFTSKKNASDYKILKSHNGPIWYPNIDKNKIKFIKNKSYKKHPKITRIKNSNALPFGIKNNIPLYKEFIEKPESFDFINNPKSFLKSISIKK